MNLRRPALPIGLSLAAGALDALTGAGLVFAPQFLLPLMGADVPGTEALVYLRFVGTFVGVVGLSYLWGVIEWRRCGDPSLLREGWRLTVLFRLAAGGYVLAAVGAGWLAAAWLLVTATDWILAALQFGLARKGVFHVG